MWTRNVETLVFNHNHQHHNAYYAYISPFLALIMASVLILSITQAAADSSEPVGGDSSSRVPHWQVITKHNFSSQIRLHANLLLLVTVPWSGESRSLMKELVQLVANKQEKFGTLKLMLLYRNREKMLANAIGATEGITILCYHHSLSYKYQGRLRAQNILSSVQFLMALPPEKLSLESLQTTKDLKAFLQSTDKALLLLEVCGWTHALLAKGKNNETDNAFDGLSGDGFPGETGRSLASMRTNNQKGMDSEKMTCGVQSGVGGIPWLGEFSSVSDSDFLEAKNMSPTVGISCSFEEFQQFDSFFSKFMTVVREFFLPPERLKFGVIPERSLLSSLGVGDPGSWLSSLDVGDSRSWLMVLYFAGCSSCTKVLREGDDLENALLMPNSLVIELGGGEHVPEPALPANRPSVLLFIDRSSDSSKARRKSKEAIDIFRNLALHHHTSYGMVEQNNVKTEKSLSGTYQASIDMPGHPSFKLSQASQNVALQDKVSIVVINEGNQVVLDKFASGLQDSSLHEVLAYVLQHKNEIKLSSLAKEVGFQLLSQDFDVRIQEVLPGQTKVLQTDQVVENPKDGLPEASVDLHKDQIPDTARTSAVEHEEQYKPANADESSRITEETIPFDTNNLLAGEPDHFHGNRDLGSAEDGKVEQKSFSEIADLGQDKRHVKGFAGSFFFLDGEYQLLKALTAGSMIPSVVILDPISQKHYVLPEETVFSYSSISDFLDGFINDSLLPYQRSEYVVPSPREVPFPPFVNLDFHEADSIPRVTSNTFSQLVIGSNQFGMSNAAHAGKKDVLVLFSNSWCGFCQRMELVVREVHRALKHYATLLKNKPKKEKYVLTDVMKDNELKLPLIYLMDCTLNDCSLILRSVAKRELYPSLILFPAERKNAVSYEGDVAVADIIKFIADHGHFAHDLVRETGMEQKSKEQNLFEDASQIAIHNESPLSKDNYHEVLLQYRIPERVLRYNEITPPKSNGLHGAVSQVMVGSLLIATEKLLKVSPFDNSTILIVKAEESTGFLGLIINKYISWDSLHELEEGFELLTEARLSFGGPIFKHGMPLVALTRRIIKGQYREVLPNVYFLDQWTTIHEIEGLKLHNYSVIDYWFFLGYSSWGWDQLFDEIAQGAWNFSSANVELLDCPW